MGKGPILVSGQNPCPGAHAATGFDFSGSLADLPVTVHHPRILYPTGAGNRPTSVLLDLELPDGHGLDILRELPVGVPVVALTGDESRETKLLCRHAGCSAVLSKSGHLGNLGRLMTNMEDHPQECSDTTALEPELARQYSTFLTQTRVELQQARERSDLETVRRLAHRLKGTAIHFGYSGISASARALGDILASGDSRRIQSTLEELIGRLTDATVHHSTH